MKEHVRLELSLDKDVVEWVDSIKNQLGLRSRGGLINRMLLEIKGDAEEPDEKPVRKSLRHRIVLGSLWVLFSTIPAAWVGTLIEPDMPERNDKAQVVIAVFSMLAIPGSLLIGQIVDE